MTEWLMYNALCMIHTNMKCIMNIKTNDYLFLLFAITAFPFNYFPIFGDAKFIALALS